MVSGRGKSPTRAHMGRVRCALLTLASVSVNLALASCSGGDSAGAADATGPAAARPVAVVSVSAPSSSLLVGCSLQLSAAAKDASGKSIATGSIAWRSSSNAVATVTADGVVAGTAPGAVTITATANGQNGSIELTVVPVPVASIAVSPGAASVPVGASVQLAAKLADAEGAELLGRTVAWSSNTTVVAVVSEAGRVTGVAPGTATVTATAEGRTASTVITVTRTTGALSLTVDGVPAGTPSTVTVTGPNDFRVVATGTQTFSNVQTGTYQIAAGTVTSGGAWYPTAAMQTMSVVAGQTASVRVRYRHLPTSGAFVAGLAGFDDAVLDFMGRRNIRAGTVAVMRGGRVMLSRGYGWYDEAATRPIAPDALFRLASVTKGITNAAIMRLVAEGHLSLSAKVFPLLGIAPLPAGAAADSRLNDITVQHLLEQKGGWNTVGSNPDVRTVSRDLGLSGPPTPTQIAQWVMGRPLQFAPGTQAVYSNFGYSLLGLVVERLSGQTYTAYVQRSLFPAGARGDVILARTLPEHRDPREPWYADSRTGCSVFVINACVVSRATDGGISYFESYHSYGGLVASAPAVLTFLDAFWLHGGQRPSGATGGSLAYFGSMQGTFTLARQRPDGMNIVALFNQNEDPSGADYADILTALDQVADRVVWP